MRRTMRIQFPVILVMALWVLPALGGGYIVVVHQDNPVDSMSGKEVSDLFLKVSTRFPSGGEAVPIDLGEASSTRVAFSKGIHNRSIKAVKWYWQKRRFAVGGTAPAQATSEANLLKFVSTNEKAIGYVAAGADIEAFPVKVVRITD